MDVQREAGGRLLVTLVANEREVQVRLSGADIGALVGSAHWHERGTFRAGESAAGAPVFWASDGDQARLLIGHDDEARDVATTVPFDVVDEIIRAAIASEVPVTSVQSYEPPPPDAVLVTRLRAAIAAVPDLHEAYLVARRTAWPKGEGLALGVVAHAGGCVRSGGSVVERVDQLRSGCSEPLSAALEPFSPPSDSAPLGWVAYSTSPVRDEVRVAGIRLT